LKILGYIRTAGPLVFFSRYFLLFLIRFKTMIIFKEYIIEE
jgi:hypothetical protein